MIAANIGIIITKANDKSYDFIYSDFPNYDRNEKHRYMVPKSCVEWKTSDSDHMTRVYYSSIRLKIPIFGSGNESKF